MQKKKLIKSIFATGIMFLSSTAGKKKIWLNSQLNFLWNWEQDMEIWLLASFKNPPDC